MSFTNSRNCEGIPPKELPNNKSSVEIFCKTVGIFKGTRQAGQRGTLDHFYSIYRILSKADKLLASPWVRCFIIKIILDIIDLFIYKII